MLQIFCAAINETLQSHLEMIEKIKMMRSQLQKALSCDIFRLNCLESILHYALEEYQADQPWGMPPLYHDLDFRYTLRIAFWPGFYETPPHCHKTWSITGVFHNQLDFFTYDLLENPKRLKQDRAICGTVGEVGYLIPGCIHNVRNPSHAFSASIHILHHLSDHADPRENVEWYFPPQKYDLKQGLRERILITALEILKNIYNEKSFQLLHYLNQHAPRSIRWMTLPLLQQFNLSETRACFDSLISTEKELYDDISCA